MSWNTRVAVLRESQEIKNSTVSSRIETVMKSLNSLQVWKASKTSARSYIRRGWTTTNLLNIYCCVRTNIFVITTGAKKWQCGFCGILVSSKFYLSSHINAVHTRTRIYPCEICGRLFYSHGAQRIHKLRYHWVDKRHKCPQCNQMFVLPVELRQHIQRKHKHALMWRWSGRIFKLVLYVRLASMLD